MTSQVGQQQVCVSGTKLDKYGRLLGVVKRNGKDINLAELQAGLAWHYKRYQNDQTPTDRTLYAAAEAKARSEVKGLWSEPNPINPELWREHEHPRNAGSSIIPAPQTEPKAVIEKTTPSAVTNFSCGEKRFCSQMQSCVEACFYLHTCGLVRLDGNGDGVPCEALCAGVGACP